MLSALLAGNVGESAGLDGEGSNKTAAAAKTGLLGVSAPYAGDALDLTGFGVAPLSHQTEAERAYAPLPAPSGQLVHDPDFSLPTTAGQLPWRLFHYSNEPDSEGNFGYGRRASWPLRLCAEQKPAEGSVITVMLEREDGLGVSYVSTDAGTNWTPLSPRLFDTLSGDPATGFVETRRDSGTTFHYPAGGFVSLSYFETVHGKRVTFGYDGTQHLTSITEPAGRSINLGYNPDKYVEQVTDWASRSHQFTYDSGDLKTIVDPEGYVTTFASDGLHRLTGIQAPTGFVTTFTYDDDNRVTSRSIDGHLGQYAYSGNSVVYTDPFGKVWTTYLDALGNVTHVVDPIGATRAAFYNPKGQPYQLQDGQGRDTFIGYDSVTGHEASRHEPTLGTYNRLYDSYANLLTDTDPLGRTHIYSYGYDSSQRLVHTATDPLGHVTTYSHTAWGAVETVQSPLGFVTTYTWDNDKALLTSETDPLGFVRTYQYDLAGNRTLERDEAGKDTVYVYDALGRQTLRTDPLGHAQETIYDGVGNVTVRVDALGHRTTYGYNAYNEEVVEWDARGFRHTTLYDAKGRETGRRDPNNHLTQSVYDFADNRIGQIDALGRRTTTQYDLARRPVTLIDTTGLAYVTEYDGFDTNPAFRTVAQRSPGGQRTTSVYDSAGQLIASIDTAGHRTTFVYDNAGRLLATIEPSGARTTTLYDNDGRSVGMIDALGHRTTSTYDARGQLTVSQDAEGKLYTTMYDGRGMRTAEYSPDGTFVLRSYDDAGRAIGTTNELSLSTATQYDALGQVRTFTDEWNRSTADEYDPNGLVRRSRDYLDKISIFTRDPAGRMEAVQGPTGNLTNFAYDASNAVTMISDSVAGSGLDDLPEIDYFYWDEFGRFHAVANTKGERTTTGYDTYGRVSYEMDADGQQNGFIYDDFGRWAAQQDADGYRVTTNFDPYGRQVGYTDELGYTTTFTLDLLDRPIAEIDPDGSVTTFSYDEVSRIIGRTDPLGVSATTVYDKRGNVSAQVDALGYRTTYYYDPFSRNIAVENALGYRTSSSYDSLGRVNATTNARGYATTTLFDSFSRPEATQNALGQLSTTVYDAFGRVEAYQDALGYRTSTVYDARGRVIGQIDALGYRTTTLYDNVGRSWASVDALGRRTTTLYDSVGRVTGQVSPLGYITTTLYDNRGNAKAQMDARGYVTSYGYDARGQQIWQMDALGFVTTSMYDGMGRMVAGVDAFGYRTTTTYDLRGQIKTRQDALGVVTTSLYDVLGRSVGQIDALGRTTTSVYDPIGRTMARVNPLGERMSMAYDQVGNRLAVVNALGYATSYSYDILDRQDGWMDPLGRRHTMAFDAVGRVVSMMDAKGQVTSHSYNGRGEETYRIYADGQTVSMIYDAAGQTGSIWDTAGVFTYGYDRNGRLQSVLGPDYPGRVPVTYSYDPSGNRVGMASWWGLFTYGYDARGQMATVQDPGAYYEYVDGGTTSFIYDRRGQKVGQQNANGTTTSLVYDAVGRLLQTRAVAPDGTTEVAQASYAYDIVGRPLFKDTNLARHTYSYDALDRLINEEMSGQLGDFFYRNATYTYDAAGRRVKLETLTEGKEFGFSTLTLTYDAADELVTTRNDGGTTTYTYDANGSRLSILTPFGNAASYSWDGANRLQSVALPFGVGITTQVYGSDGLRHAQVLPNSRGGGVEVSLWDEASGGNLAPLSWKGRFAGTTAAFVSTDTTRQGSWAGFYGSEGFVIATGGETVSGASNLPRYAEVNLGTADPQLWEVSTTDVRALQKPATLSDRIAAAYRLNPVVVDVNLKDERPHIVSLYLLDWDNLNRSGTLTVTDADTSATLYTQNVSGYGDGLWVRLRVSGHVTITLQNNSATVPTAGAVVSGVFFDPILEANNPNGTVDVLAQVFSQAQSGQGDLLTASGSTRRNLAVARQYHEDALGTTEATTQAPTQVRANASLQNGQVQVAYALDAWGNVLAEQFGEDGKPVFVADNPFLFLGGLGYWNEPNLGLSYVRARWLDTGVGQWMSVDPVDGEPRYSYAYQSPTLYTDASGTDSQNWLMHQVNRGWRWLYTGNPDANDGVYNAAVGSGLQTLESEIGTIQAKKKAFLQNTEQAIHHWAKAQNPRAYKNLSAIMAVAAPLLPIGRIEDKILSGVEKWFEGGAKQAHSQTGSGVLPWLHALLPPALGTRGEFLYKVGFLWGFCESTLNLFDLVSQVAYVLDFALKTYATEDIWGAIKGAVQEFIAPFMPKDLSGLDYFERGKLAAVILFNVLLIVLIVLGEYFRIKKFLKERAAAKSAAEALEGNAGAKQSLREEQGIVGRLVKQAQKNKNSIIAATEIQKRMGPQRLTVEDVKNAIKREVKEIRAREFVKNPLLTLFEKPGFVEQFKNGFDARVKSIHTAAEKWTRDPRNFQPRRNETGEIKLQINWDQTGMINLSRNGVPYASCEAEATAIYLELQKYGVKDAQIVNFRTEAGNRFTSPRVESGMSSWGHHQFVQVGDYVIDQTSGWTLENPVGYKPELKRTWEAQFRPSGPPKRYSNVTEPNLAMMRLLGIVKK